MSNYHSISISVGQLRQWQDGQDKHLRNLASSAVLACLDSDLYSAVVRDVSASAGASAHDITASHLDSLKGDDFTALVRIRGDDIRMAASIDKPELVSLRELIKMVVENNLDEGDEA